MKLEFLGLITVFALSQPALAVDAKDGSPSDKNPKCMDRTTDSSTEGCVIKAEGAPRHKYPPKTQTKPAAPASTKAGSTAR